MTIEELRERKLIVLESISGSKAYGLDTPTSDTDIKGVFVLPQRDFYAMNYIPQVSNETNDIVFYELGRFIELLLVNNPNILELLYIPTFATIYKHPVLNQLNEQLIISKQCKKTFGKFAMSQIKKARGLKKKIVNPVDKQRKNILSFCYVNFNNGSLPISNYLALKGWKQEDCGLVKIPQMKNMYGLYHTENSLFNGVMKAETSNEVMLSSIPKGINQEALLYFNKDAYSRYCKDYKEYWDWVTNRNEERYQNTKRHGKNYDAKNIMHTFRLLAMAIEIAEEHKINVWRGDKDRDFLLDIKRGKFEYDELLEQAEQKQSLMELAFNKSTLAELPNKQYIRNLAYLLRKQFYEQGIGEEEYFHYIVK